MSLWWHFVDLSEEQLRDRRRLLDGYGQFAQLSILFLPLCYQLSLGVRLLARRLSSKTAYQPLKEIRNPVPARLQAKRPASSSLTGRGVSWWLGKAIATGWETRGECLLAATWAAWLLLLVIKDTGDDYLHLTKRFGIVAASQLPMHYLLAAKGWSPVQFLTRMSHEELNPYHRLLGRIIVIFFACHASLYLNFFIQKDLLAKRIRNWDVILGLTAISSASLLFTTALAKVRDYNYRIFFYAHVALASLLLPVLYLHVSHLRLYILESAAIFTGIIIQRNVYQTTLSATITGIAKTNLLSISIPLRNNLDYKIFEPGQHIYLGSPSLVKKLVKNPFTIANIPTYNDNRLLLVVRSLTGPTASLKSFTSHPQPIPITIEGPYGAANYFPHLPSYDRILLVSGGVGATFTIPLYARLSNAMPMKALRFVWAVRDLQHTEWAERGLLSNDTGSETAALDDQIRIYVTEGSASGGEIGSNGDADSIELQQVRKLNNKPLLERLGRNSVKRGRPDLREIVDEVFEHDPTDRVAVLFCGPAGMGASLRKEVGRWVASSRDVFWHNEQFGW